MATQTVKFDLMRPAIGGGKKFIATMKYPHCPAFKFNLQNFYEWICDKRPSLKGQKLACEFYGNDKTTLFLNMSEREIIRYEQWNSTAR